jgi:hypothetical protein
MQSSSSLALDTPVRNRLFAHFLFFLFQEHVKNLVKDSSTIGFFTLHGLSHIQAVDESVDRLLSLQSQQSANAISPIEKLVLRFCAWSHDLGMLKTVAHAYSHSKNRHDNAPPLTDEELRKDHDNASAWYLQKQLPALISGFVESMQKAAFQTKQAEALRFLAETLKSQGIDDEKSQAGSQHFIDWLKQEPSEHLFAIAINMVTTVNLISGYHRRSEPIDRCPEYRVLIDDSVRSQLLAAIFRLGDALHVDRTRFSTSAFDAIRDLPEFTEENRVHWIKSFIISNIRIDPQTFTVHVQADFPRRLVKTENDHKEEVQEEELITFVKTDLDEDVSSVSQILLKHGFPPMLGVSHSVHRIPQMPYWDQIKPVLSTIIAAASPNTSQLLKIALDGLAFRLSEAQHQPEDKQEEYLLSEVATHIGAIQQQLQRRRCHQSLRKLSELLETIKGAYLKDPLLATPKKIFSSPLRGYGRLMFTLFEGAHQVFRLQQQQIDQVIKAPPDCFISLLEKYQRIILYGFSQQVLSLIGLQKHLPTSFHVLECRTKTRYTPTGHLHYLDGERYAKRLSAVINNRHEKRNIWLEPDAAIAKIIKNAGTRENCVLLVGSNAVYANGTCVHSLGHLTVASVAKQFNCDVIVVTDGSKIGSKPHLKPGTEEPQRYPDQWLTHIPRVREELQMHGITLRNWQEDEIPPELVDQLVIFDQGRILKGSTFPKEVAQFEFDPILRFCKDLDRRLLAATIAARREHDKAFNESIGALGLQGDANTQNWLIASDFLSDRPEIKYDCSSIWTGDLKKNADEFKRQLGGPSWNVANFAEGYKGRMNEPIQQLVEDVPRM